MNCVICGHDCQKKEDVSQYAAFGGLPSPCCTICFEVNDYSITSREELALRSLLRRAADQSSESTSGN